MTGPDVRPPSFVRRHMATSADTDDVLIGLACDENMWVRREALKNPATPRWILDLLTRAGADPELRGRREPDPDMPPEDLRRLVEGGPWARQLVADHPNTTAEILDALAGLPSDPIRLAVAAHQHCSASTLARLCADADDRVRQHAARHAHCPPAVLTLMQRAGADPDLAHVGGAVDDDLTADELDSLGRLGPWGRFLAARHRSCPAEMLDLVAADSDWRIRSAVLDNPNSPDDMLAFVAGIDSSSAVDVARPLSHADSTPEQLAGIASHQQAEVRLAVARHPHADVTVIGLLAVDRVADVRRIAAAHSLMDKDLLSLLVRAGSTADLSRLAPPDDSIVAADLVGLSRGGYWARQLAVRHPATSPETLGHLLCDEDPKLREWAAAHPSAPASVIAEIRRAGGAQDFQGIAEADPTMSPDDLLHVASLGPYGQWIAAWHPNAPDELRQARMR